MATRHDANGSVRALADERELLARRRPGVQPAGGEPLTAQQMLLALQRGVGNQAVGRAVRELRDQPSSGATLQRKFKIGTKPWWKSAVPVPEIPQRFVTGPPAIPGGPPPPANDHGYRPETRDRAKQIAEDWREDKTTANRTFATAEALYQAIFTELITQGAVVPAASSSPFLAMKHELDKGGLREVPWSSFKAPAATALLTELLACPVQVAGNGVTSANHANEHGVLPRNVTAPGGQPLASLPYAQQYDTTPYVEFLITGHKRADKTEIERGMLDKISGQIYITDHYTGFVWLSGAPPALATNWQQKAAAYRAGL